MALSIAPSLRVGAKSHVGKVRKENQDRMSRFTSPLGEVFIVADGMGGHQGGLTAVVMTVDGLDSFLRNLPPQTDVPGALRTAAQETNTRVYRLANSNDPSIAKMGSTVVLTLIEGNKMWVGHAGDSRAYLYRNHELARLTKDHSMVQKMIDHDMLTEEQARNHPDASVITRAFGQQSELELEVSGPMEMRPGDGVLLCTDGLCGYVGDEAIAKAIEQNRDAQEVTAALIDLALAAGGEDNVTVQYIYFPSTEEQARLAIGSVPQQTAPLPVGGKVLEAVPEKDKFPLTLILLIVAIVLGALVGWLLGSGGVGFNLFWQNEEEPRAISSPSPSPERREAKPASTPIPEETKEKQHDAPKEEPGDSPKPLDRPVQKSSESDAKRIEPTPTPG